MEPPTKKRKVRKGTHSCWECKRRKVRCTLVMPTDEVCIPCKRRGLQCVSQELEPPEQQPIFSHGHKRLAEFEVLLHELSKKVEGSESVSFRRESGYESMTPPVPFVDLPTPSSSAATPASEATSSRESHTVERQMLQTPSSRNTFPATNKNERISAKLLAALPSPAEIALIESRIPSYAWLCFKSNFVSRSVMQRQISHGTELNEDVGCGLDDCNMTTHPVLIASKMLKLASGMIYIPPQDQAIGLRESYLTIRTRLIETATRLVTMDDSLLNSIGGLECVIREGLCHLEVGNLRRGWTTFRHATTIGQLIGLQRHPCPPRESLGVGNDYDPQAMWFRVIWIDRFITSLLGLPHSNSRIDDNWGGGLESVTPVERLERMHAEISVQLLERNQMSLSQETIDKTMDLDRRLITAAQALPDQFWRTATWKDVDPSSGGAFEICLNTRDQIIHYSLLNQLHLPFLLCPNMDAQASYSKAACMTASREVLTLVTSFCNFNPTAACCRTFEFLALIAGMTLMLAHIDGHCRSLHTNVLVHQRLSDRGVVEQALEAMQDISKFSKDVWAAKCADVLRHLLHVEADASRGQRYFAENLHDGQVATPNDDDALYITVPYFPTIKIAKQGIVATRLTRRGGESDEYRGEPITLGGLGSLQVGGNMSGHVTTPAIPGPYDDGQFRGSSQMLGERLPTLTNTPTGQGNGVPSEVMFGNMASGMLGQEPMGENGPADFNDWGFQGVDLAFLDNLTWTLGT